MGIDEKSSETVERLKINSWLPVLAVSYLHGRGEFFATSFARIDNAGFMKTECIKSSDPVFGVRVPLPEKLEIGERYLLNFRFKEDSVEYIMLGNRTIYERVPEPALLRIPFGGVEASMSKKGSVNMQLRIIAEESEPLLTFVRDRQLARWVETVKGKWRLSMQAESMQRHCSEWSEVDEELELPLRIDVSVELLPPGPEDVRSVTQYCLPQGLRFWRGPTLHHKIDTNIAAHIEPQAFELPDYKTDKIDIIENDDTYGETREPAYGSRLIEELESHLSLCDRYRVSSFTLSCAWSFISDRPYIKRFIELLKEGKGQSIRFLVFTMGGPPVEQELGEKFVHAFCKEIHNILEQLPDRFAVIRIMEINTNGQWSRPNAVPNCLFPEKIYDKDIYEIENRIFIEEHCKQWQKIKDWVGFPERTKISIQDDGPVANPHWAEAGMDYFITKNIWNFNTNIVQAVGRGFARAFKKPIGLAYDSHRGLDYEVANLPDIEHVYRSYFFAGMEKTMYEAPFTGVDSHGVKRLTESGAKFYEIMHWAMTHPERGEEIVQIGFIKGSDDYGLRIPGPGPTRHGYRHRLLLHDHPAYRDWNLMDIVFPEYGNYEGSNPYRFLTGTPYGQADVLPYNAAPEHLSKFKTLVMVGRNRLTPQAFENYLGYVHNGGRLVLALEHLLDEQPRIRKYADMPIHQLIGATTGEDVNILPTRWDEFVPSKTCFYNKVENISAEVLERLPGGDPLLLCNQAGAGKAYFYTSEFLTSVNEDSPRRLLKQLFECDKLLDMHPETGWVQYFIRRRSGIVMLGLINHGQAGFPQGFGPKTGKWKGRIELKITELGLVPEETEAFVLDEGMKLHPLDGKAGSGRLVFDIEIDVWSELVLGPKGLTRQRLFKHDIG